MPQVVLYYSPLSCWKTYEQKCPRCEVAPGVVVTTRFKRERGALPRQPETAGQGPLCPARARALDRSEQRRAEGLQQPGHGALRG